MTSRFKQCIFLFASAVSGGVVFASAAGVSVSSAAEGPLPGQGAEVWNVARAVDVAWKQDPGIRAARERINEAQARHSVVISQALPSVAIQGGLSTRQEAFTSPSLIFGGDPFNFYEFGLEAKQPLFRGGALFGGLKLASKERAIRELDLEIRERDVTLQTLEIFYLILLNQKQVETLRRTEAIQKELLTVVRRKQRIGLSKELEPLQIQTKLALIAPEIERARSQMTLNAARLARFLGLSGQKNLKITGSLEAPDWDRIKARMKERMGESEAIHPELRLAGLNEERFEGQKQLEMSKHWPQLYLVGSFFKNATKATDLVDPNRTSWAFGVQLSIPVFSGLSYWFERNAFAAARAALDADRERVRDDVRLAIVEAEEGIAVAGELVRASRESMETARKTEAVARRLFKVGRATFQEVSETQRDLTSAEFAYEQARYDYLMKIGRYFQASGWPMKDWVEELEKRGQLHAKDS